MKIYSIAFFSIVTAMFGCKPLASKDSDTASIDNFASGKVVHINQCQAPNNTSKQRKSLVSKIIIGFDGKRAKREQNDLKLEVQSSLLTIPENILTMFNQIGGSILVSDNTNSICTSALPMEQSQRNLYTNGKRQFSSCQVRDYDQSKVKGVGLAIIVNSKASDIRHSLVRSMGYAIIDSAAYLTNGSDGNYEYQTTKSPGIQKLTSTIALNFVADLYGSKKFYSMMGELERSHLGPGAFAKMYENSEKLGKKSDSSIIDSKLWQGVTFNTTSDKRSAYKDVFEKSMFAETFDSYYCNSVAPFDKSSASKALFEGDMMSQSERNVALKNTRKVLQEFFPETYASFKASEQLLLRGAGQFGKKLSSGFSLADESYYGTAGRYVGSLWGSAKSGVNTYADQVANPIYQKVSGAARDGAAAASGAFDQGRKTIAKGAQVLDAGIRATPGYVFRKHQDAFNAVIDHPATFKSAKVVNDLMQSPDAVGKTTVGGELGKDGAKVSGSQEFSIPGIYRSAQQTIYGGDPYRGADNLNQAGENAHWMGQQQKLENRNIREEVRNAGMAAQRELAAPAAMAPISSPVPATAAPTSGPAVAPGPTPTPAGSVTGSL